MSTSPDVVISDILMPKMDGFALSRAIKRDVALRDTPVILLSWKEDLLQRVRELGASAAAYLRKESDARSVLARVREVLWPRARVEARLKGTGEVRGRLDGLTVRSLLEFVSNLRQDARVSIRDASCLYEVELREGAPRRATRTSGDGNFARGPKVMRELLGVSAGRFIVAPPTQGALVGELTGTLAEQLAKHVASARGAMAVTTGAHATRAARLQLDDDVLSHYLRATPEPSRSLIVRLSKGTSPRALLLEGEVVPSLLDDVLTDLAAHGAIVGVYDEEGREVLEPAITAALAVLQSAPARNATPLSPIRPSLTPPPVISKPRDGKESSVNVSIEKILHEQEQAAAPKPSVSKKAAVETSLQVSVQQLLDEEARVLAEERRTPTLEVVEEEGKPHSLEDAVIQKLSETSPVPGTHPRSSPLPPPIIEPSVLRPRSNPPTTSEANAPEPPSPEPPAEPPPREEDHTEVETVYEAKVEREPEPPRKTEEVIERPTRPATPRSLHPTQKESPVRWVALLAMLMLGAALAIRMTKGQAPPEPPPGPATSVSSKPSATAPGSAPLQVVYGEPPADAVLDVDQGWLDVHATGGAAVLVDGTERPAGPISAGSHDIRVGDRTESVEIKPGKATRIDWP
jgi:CheY-like chemotaxis protein